MSVMSSGPITIRAEFKPLLSVVNILLDLPSCVVDLFPRVTVEVHSVSVETTEWHMKFPISHLTINPSSCRGLRWNSESELQLTLQAAWTTIQGNSGDADNILAAKKEFQSYNQDRLISKIKSSQSRCYCAGCDAHLLKSTCEFKRVLPLPSENWSDFADIWFCHNHTDGTESNHSCHNHSGESTLPEQYKQIKVTGLTPRPEDCLVSSLYMLVSARHVKPGALICTADRLVCKRCGNFVGFVKLGNSSSKDQTLHSFFHDPLNSVYKMYFHAISFQDAKVENPVCEIQVPRDLDSKLGNNERELSIEDFISTLLKDQSRLFTSFRFIIDSTLQGDGKNMILILLWLLDQELAVFSASSLEKTPVASPDSLQGDNHLDHYSVPNILPCTSMKLLYKATFLPIEDSKPVKSLTPDVFNAWQKDNTVHSISLPYPLCKQLVSLLISSTKQLTLSQRNLNGFHVGYLKTR
ncbi:E3 ubiquitin-protein ligase E3D-like [Physella acuta]|uniref:E3 ubiquitin-protein ligase E3D-like n=1 Tax=Physella acuta TaxID=109671 RepID=UPI0027DC0956|nr:E3 ubiquitin-protein ligase E3D-like [Physella acuta]